MRHTRSRTDAGAQPCARRMGHGTCILRIHKCTRARGSAHAHAPMHAHTHVLQMEAWHQERTQVRKLEAFIEQIAQEVENKASALVLWPLHLVRPGSRWCTEHVLNGVQACKVSRTCTLTAPPPHPMFCTTSTAFLQDDPPYTFSPAQPSLYRPLIKAPTTLLPPAQSSTMARVSEEHASLEGAYAQLQDLLEQGHGERQVLEQRLAQVRRRQRCACTHAAAMRLCVGDAWAQALLDLLGLGRSDRQVLERAMTRVCLLTAPLARACVCLHGPQQEEMDAYQAGLCL